MTLLPWLILYRSIQHNTTKNDKNVTKYSSVACLETASATHPCSMHAVVATKTDICNCQKQQKHQWQIQSHTVWPQYTAPKHMTLPWTFPPASHWLAFPAECSKRCGLEKWHTVPHRARREWQAVGTIARCPCGQDQTYCCHRTCYTGRVHCQSPLHSLTLHHITQHNSL